MQSMFPLLLAALLIWAGVFAFIFSVDRKVRALERRVEEKGGTAPSAEEGRLP